MILNRNIAFVIFSLPLLGFFSGCNKQDVVVNQSSMKEYCFTDATMTVVYMEQVAANDILLIGAENSNAYMIHTDLKGNLLSHKTIMLPDSFSIPNYIYLDIRKLNNGAFLFNRGGYGKFALITNSGNVLWDREDSIYGGTQSNVIYAPAKNEYIEGWSGGGSTGGYSPNGLDIFDGSGNYLKRNYYNDTSFAHGKTLSMDVVGTTPNGEYKVFGHKFLVPGNWNAPTRIYVGTTSGQHLNTTIIDSAVSGISDVFTNYYIDPSDSAVIIYGTRINGQRHVNTILFLRFDANMVFQAENVYTYNNSNTIPYGMSKCHDGSFLVYGFYSPSTLPNAQGAASFAQPYVIRIDKNGHKIWEKGFKMTSSAEFFSALELSDGSILMGGAAYGFGKGISPTGNSVGNLLIMKLDANGNQE